MTVGENMLNKIDECICKAREFAKKNEWNIATFWKNASIGLKMKMEKMTISELEKKI